MSDGSEDECVAAVTPSTPVPVPPASGSPADVPPLLLLPSSSSFVFITSVFTSESESESASELSTHGVRAEFFSRSIAPASVAPTGAGASPSSLLRSTTSC